MGWFGFLALMLGLENKKIEKNNILELDFSCSPSGAQADEHEEDAQPPSNENGPLFTAPGSQILPFIWPKKTSVEKARSCYFMTKKPTSPVLTDSRMSKAETTPCLAHQDTPLTKSILLARPRQQ